MIVLVLKSIIALLSAGIVFYLFKIFCLFFQDYLFPQWYAKHTKKKNRQALSKNVVMRAADSLARVTAGEIKLEGLCNEASPHNEGNSVANYKDTLSKPKLLSMIKEVKEFDYYGQN